VPMEYVFLPEILAVHFRHSSGGAVPSGLARRSARTAQRAPSMSRWPPRCGRRPAASPRGRGAHDGHARFAAARIAGTVHRPVRATWSSSAPRGARPPRRGSHGTPTSSISAEKIVLSTSSFSLDWLSTCPAACSSPANSVSSPGPHFGPAGMLYGFPSVLQRHREQPPAPALVPGPGRGDLTAE